MFVLATPKRRVVSDVGAPAEGILCGVGFNNQGLRLRIRQAQPRGADGPVRGGFIVLSTGDNRHAVTLADFVGKLTNAEELLAALRRHSAACVHVVNTGALAVEADRAEGIVSDPDCDASARAPTGAVARPAAVVSDPDA